MAVFNLNVPLTVLVAIMILALNCDSFRIDQRFVAKGDTRPASESKSSNIFNKAIYYNTQFNGILDLLNITLFYNNGIQNVQIQIIVGLPHGLASEVAEVII